ncbi:MAG: winged helix-turn-helix transcriptional regulator [Bacteroidales bacterium]|nr:winged helix-turn-helix transcriptional regulator [Bacteroidales bacterium]
MRETSRPGRSNRNTDFSLVGVSVVAVLLVFCGKATNIGKSSITKSVKILEKKGFLTKEIDSQDNRKKYIKITPKGLEVQKLAVRMNDEIENKINEEFGENEINELKEKLEQLKGIIKVP